MGVNKVNYGSKVLIDLTGDTVSAENLLKGYTAHNAAGEAVNGAAVIPKKSVWYGTCKTSTYAVAEGALTVTTDTGDFTLEAGNIVVVYFQATPYSALPTINVDGTGSKAVYTNGTTLFPAYAWQDGTVVTFVYDGACFRPTSISSQATTTYYGLTMLSSAINDVRTTVAATPSAVKQAYDLANEAKTAVDDIDLSGYLPLSGGTLTGNLTGKYITGTWLQTTQASDKAGKFATIDDQGWIYYRTAAEALSDMGGAKVEYSTTDLTAGTSALETGKLYFVYE